MDLVHRSVQFLMLQDYSETSILTLSSILFVIIVFQTFSYFKCTILIVPPPSMIFDFERILIFPVLAKLETFVCFGYNENLHIQG